MKKGFLILFAILCALGLALLGTGLFMLITINSMALLKLTPRIAYLYIILHKWFMLGGGALLAIGGLAFLLHRKKKKAGAPV